MLYGIISDIHANLEAFSAVLKKLAQAEKIISLGDVVGYGPDPNACIELVRKKSIASVLGNHDAVLTGAGEDTWFNHRAKAAIAWTRLELKQENLAWLKSLAKVMTEDGFQVVHGSLRSPLHEYLTNIAEAMPTFELMKTNLCFVGHSHVPMFIALDQDGNYNSRQLRDGDEMLIDDHAKLIINVGAVGQPRDGDPRAAYALYNSQSGLFSFHRVEYDIARTQLKMSAAKLPQQLIDRLKAGL
ncbi:MAG: metallophosphoesterase family protein [Candidatus Saganbacteria bacterium]|nr:metallophosphoesterase family protein [Candidatus Saganbacteria bacterium]